MSAILRSMSVFLGMAPSYRFPPPPAIAHHSLWISNCTTTDLLDYFTVPKSEVDLAMTLPAGDDVLHLAQPQAIGPFTAAVMRQGERQEAGALDGSTWDRQAHRRIAIS